MTTARVRPMPPAELAQWRAARSADGVALPAEDSPEEAEALVVVVDGVDVGGAYLTYDSGRARCVVRALQTTLARDHEAAWSAVAEALEQHARGRGVTVLALAVAPELASTFGRAGFRATMLGAEESLRPGIAPELQEDRRVDVRPMTDPERRAFVAEAEALLREGMARAGVADATSPDLVALAERLSRLAQDPPPAEELLLRAVVDGQPVGSAWATLAPREDGGVDLFGNTLHLDPAHRGRGLSPSFVGALVRYAEAIGVVDVHLRVYGYDGWARGLFLPRMAVSEVFVRKDLAG